MFQLFAALDASICSHGRSYAYFTESIQIANHGRCAFLGYRWDRTYENIEGIVKHSVCDKVNCRKMGINSQKSFPQNEGSFFVSTNDDLPYCCMCIPIYSILNRAAITIYNILQ